MQGQRRLQQQTEQLATRMSSSQEMLEGQRRLEKKIKMMMKQMSAPSTSPPPRRKRSRQQPPREHAAGLSNAVFREQHGDRDPVPDIVPDIEYSDFNSSEDEDESDDYHSPPAKVKTGRKEGGRFRDRPRGDARGARGDGHGYNDEEHVDQDHGDHHHKAVPTARSTLRLISMRREHTLARLHGDSPIYYAAWMAEWVTCFLFTAAHLVMLVLWARHDGNQDSYVTTLFVTAIAAATYFAKACHMGDFTINGIVVPLPRYIDWLTTTPLMLYELCHIAHASFGSTFMVILCDILMIVTGMIEAMIPWEPHKGIKQIWFGMSCWFFLLMLLVLHFDVSKKAEKQNEVAASLFGQLEVLTIVVWSLYPIIVGIGRANTALITKPIEDIALCFMDVVAKIGTALGRFPCRPASVGH